MGWVIVLGFVVLTGATLWRWGGLPRSAFEPVAAALLLGLAGYAFQGSPTVAGSPVKSVQNPYVVDEADVATRGKMGQRFGNGPAWLIAADGAMRAGVPQAAVTYIKSGLKENPRDPDLWVGLGNALIVHNGGMISPAATYAFQRAADIAPAHPGPPFFMGLALAQAGQYAQARAIWTQLLGRAPAGAAWRADLETRLGELPN